jgi:Tol biopolymer transport system component
VRASTSSQEEHDPTWSPDGRFLAISRAEGAEIVIVDVTTHEDVLTIAEEGGPFKFPAWQY